MKILSLEITNLASISHAVIDFGSEPLRSCNTFLISGPTGAGKTTILDAISLALYNKTPRLQGERGRTYQDALERIRKGTNQAEVIMHIIGNDGVHYVVTWIDRLTRGGNVTVNRTLQNFTTGEMITNIDEAIRNNIVGLDNTQFFRTTMLAQQEFTKFLQASEAEKSRILAKLSDTERYDQIGQQINKQSNEADAQVKRIKENIGEANVLSAEAVEEIQNKQQEAQKQIAIEGKETQRLQEVINRLSLLQINRQDLLTEQQNIAKSKSDYQRGLWQIHIARQQKEMLNNEIAAIQAQTSLSTEQQRIISNYTSIISQLDNRRNIIKRIGTMQNDIDSAQQQLPQLQAAAQEKQKIAASALEHQNACQSIADKLQPIETLQQESKNINDRLVQLLTFKNLRISLEHLIADKNNNIQQQKNAATALSTLQKQQSDAELKCSEANDKLAIAVKQQQDTLLRASENLSNIRQSLKIGDTCPVCGNKVIKILEEGFFADERDKAQEAKNQAQAAVDEATAVFRQTITRIAAQQAEIGQLSKQETIIQNNIQTTQNQLQRLTDYQQLQTADDIQLQTYEQTLNNQRHQTDAAIKQINETNTKLNNAIRAYQQAQNDATIALNIVNQKQELIKARQTDINNANHELSDIDNQLNSYIGNYIADWQKADYTELNKQITLFYDSYNKSKQLLQQKETALEQIENKLLLAQDSQKSCLLLLPELQLLTAIECTYSERFDVGWNTIENHLDSTTKRISELEKQKAELSRQLGNITLEQLPAVQQELATHSELQNQAVAANAKYQEQLEHNRKEQDKVANYELQLAEAMQKKARWNELNTIFGGKDGKNFQQIAQAHVLRFLLSQANRYLEQLTSRYSLTCEPNSLIIQVIDHDAGEQRRDSANLSGGESFIASLALALALSDLHADGLKVDTLFIDEGFGTLSNEPLQNAINTLLNLHKLQNGRKVGIISHVEALKENIHPQIMVNKGIGDNAPSTINVVE